MPLLLYQISRISKISKICFVFLIFEMSFVQLFFFFYTYIDIYQVFFYEIFKFLLKTDKL